MKATMLFLFICSSILTGQDLKVFFPEMDEILIDLWLSEDESKLDHKMDDLADAWMEVKPILCKNIIDLPEETIYCIEELLVVMEVNASRNRAELVQPYALEMLKEMRDVRARYTSFIYPLDYLLYSYDSVVEIDYTVNDLLFGLREWFEFEDMIKTLGYEWSLYRSLPYQELMFYDQDMDVERHEAHCLKFESCLEAFKESLKSGYQPDFMLPCHEMKEAITELISLYSSNHEQI